MLRNSLLTEGKIRHISVLWMWGLIQIMFQLLNRTVHNVMFASRLRRKSAECFTCQECLSGAACDHNLLIIHYALIDNFIDLLIHWYINLLIVCWLIDWLIDRLGYYIFPIKRIIIYSYSHNYSCMVKVQCASLSYNNSNSQAIFV